ncbi:Retinol dehydrogenase 12 [Orchesella cincta]|uniref:Retinol dehydrogenase 12 n=1 Tax=Orchesella cincta TaxID=48709 RepID=A0A1D2N2T3_ORCCI|nr:Retinol dehydrogenase 12 [Orchesella cincta]
MGLLFGFLIFTGFSSFVIYVIRHLLSKHWSWANRLEEEDARGRTVIITGSSRGIGKEAAIEFADRHARVIVTARTLEAAKQTVVDIRRKTFFGEVIPMKLDLGCIQSVKEFYHEIIKSYDTIDILINNAGVLVPSNEIERTADGFETHFGVNHLGHFLLTNLLLPLLKNAENSRIVIVSSGTYQKSKLNFDDLNWEKTKPPPANTNALPHDESEFPLYKISKLANVLFAKELTKRLEGTGVHVYTLCPGNVLTGISRRIKLPLHYYFVYAPLLLLVMKTARQGCQTILYCALSKKCAYESGLMYRNCDLWTSDKYYFPDDILMPIPDKPVKLNDADASRLWDESEKCLQMKFPVV